MKRPLARFLEFIAVFLLMFLFFGFIVALVTTAIMIIIVMLAVKYLGERKS